MYHRKTRIGVCARRALGLGVVILGGCGVSLTPRGADGSRSTLNLTALDVGGEPAFVEGGANDFLDRAEPVELSSRARVIQGFIDNGSDVDVYDLGPVVPGERIVVTMTAADSLDGAIALFDDSGDALLVNDHRNVYLGRTEPFIDVVARRLSDACYVAVSATPGFDASGGYALVASKEFPVALPEPRPDVVLLVFSGGKGVVIGSRAPVNVNEFDADSISSTYTGQTEALMREVVDRIRRDYAPYHVTILSTSEGDVFEPGMSRVFFGTSDPALLGVAEGVDEYNATSEQEAIVFTDTFAAFNPLAPSLAQMGQAIANVASHEIGHLLGLVHTKDPTGIMDVTASLSELLEDQTFNRSPILRLVFPLGDQDAPRYLLDAVGGDPDAARNEKRRRAPRSLAVQSKTVRQPARNAALLSSCSLASP